MSSPPQKCVLHFALPTKPRGGACCPETSPKGPPDCPLPRCPSAVAYGGGSPWVSSLSPGLTPHRGTTGPGLSGRPARARSRLSGARAGGSRSRSSHCAGVSAALRRRCHGNRRITHQTGLSEGTAPPRVFASVCAHSRSPCGGATSG